VAGGHAVQLGKLRQENQDRERVDEARHHGARDEPHQAPELEQPRDDLDDAHQDGSGEEMLDAVVADEVDHDHGRGGGRGRNHGRAATGKGDDAGDDHGGVEADLRIDACDHREADCLRDERQRDDDAREDVTARVREPATQGRGESMHDGFRNGTPVGRSGDVGWRRVDCVVRRIGGRKSHPVFHRVPASAHSITIERAASQHPRAHESPSNIGKRVASPTCRATSRRLAGSRSTRQTRLAL